MKMILRTLALLSAAVALSSAAYANPQGGPREACREDVHSFCGDVQPGGGRIINCLQDHYKELSDDCYEALENARGRREGPPPDEENNDGAPPPPPRDSNDGTPPPPPHGDNDGPPPDSGPAN